MNSPYPSEEPSEEQRTVRPDDPAFDPDQQYGVAPVDQQIEREDVRVEPGCIDSANLGDEADIASSTAPAENALQRPDRDSPAGTP